MKAHASAIISIFVATEYLIGLFNAEVDGIVSCVS